MVVVEYIWAVKSICIFVSNDLATDQRMIRISEWLVHHEWKVHLVGTLKPSSLAFSGNGYTIERLDIRPRNGIFFYLILNVIFFTKTIFSSYQAYLAVDLDTLPGIRLATWISRKKLIWDCHEIYPSIPELYSKPLIRGFWNRVERLFLPGLKQIIAVNIGVCDHLKKFGLSPQIVHNYPVMRQLIGTIRERFDSKIILFQGHLNEGRCLDTLILMVGNLPPAFTLCIAGDGHLKNQLMTLTDKAWLQDRVRFLGMLAPDDLFEVTSRAFLGISLLEGRHENSRISLANKNLDYIMAGLPSITMNFPEYRLINNRWEVSILLDDPVQSAYLESEIIKLSEDYDRYVKMHFACLQAREVLNWGHESDKLSVIFESMQA